MPLIHHHTTQFSTPSWLIWNLFVNMLYPSSWNLFGTQLYPPRWLSVKVVVQSSSSDFLLLSCLYLAWVSSVFSIHSPNWIFLHSSQEVKPFGRLIAMTYINRYLQIYGPILFLVAHFSDNKKIFFNMSHLQKSAICSQIWWQNVCQQQY